ncbi:MAG: hypothetical protein H0V97_08975 [Actinobacteria bacterium]|nr:hypothetical protein [Actinomycetota bacterium]
MLTDGRAPAPFEDLQSSLIERVATRGAGVLESGTIVVLPSISYAREELRKIVAIQYYEERMLYVLLLLRDPNTRIIYLTSLPVDPAIVDYYLGFIPDSAAARARVELVNLNDDEPRALSAKLLERPRTIDRLRASIEDRDDAYILPFNVTDLERAVALRVGVPLFGPHPADAWLGSKSGGRQVARRAEVEVGEGAEDLRSLEEVAHAIAAIAEARPNAQAAVVKLNNGFSGQGNAIIEMDDLRSPLSASPTSFCAAEESWPSFARKLESERGIVEELIRQEDVASPSVQVRIVPGGIIEITSTHDQILGGPDDQVYLGCRFPARTHYRALIQDAAIRMAGVLARGGVFGIFGIDFLVVPRDAATPRILCSEINLRVGGTTHPFSMAKLAMDATYDQPSGELFANDRAKSYIATDNLKSDRYRGTSPGAVIDAFAESGLAFDGATATGVCLHLLGALPRYGKLGMTCIADSPVGAESLQREAVARLNAL